MNDVPNLEELLAAGRASTNGRAQPFSPEIAKARKLEQRTRTAMAVSLAAQALRRLHPDDHRSLYEQALAKVNAKRGPLPGDEDES